MTTTEMQKHLHGCGLSMRQEEYAAQGNYGQLVGRKRWAVHVTNTGAMYVRGSNPRQAYARALAKLESEKGA